MKDFRTIVEEYQKVDFTRRRAALATVIKVHGSSYRSPGARMLITDDGRWVGSISGGCLEGDALRKARQVMTDAKAITVTYDTREESNQNLGIGLGCNGVIDVLIEPVVPGDADNPVTLFEGFLKTSHPLALATVFAPAGIAGRKLLVGPDGMPCGGSAGPLPETLGNDLGKIFDTRKSEARRYETAEGPVDVFLELVQPVVRLILFGAGFDARPVSQLARSLGWEVEVTDECVAHIAPVFFPEATKLSLCQREFIDRDFEITPYTACVLMSHNYAYDRDVLEKLIAQQAPYIGILGPRKRFDKMQEEFEARGIRLTSDQLAKIHSPIGLDIGAEAPDEIAVSIVAEIQSVFSNRSGGFLKYRSGPIHQRDAGSDQVFKQVYLNEPTSRSAGGKSG
jgi:xanthine/CO dehydrogenase XdhC/CoxF family maturation factor